METRFILHSSSYFLQLGGDPQAVLVGFFVIQIVAGNGTELAARFPFSESKLWSVCLFTLTHKLNRRFCVALFLSSLVYLCKIILKKFHQAPNYHPIKDQFVYQAQVLKALNQSHLKLLNQANSFQLYHPKVNSVIF